MNDTAEKFANDIALEVMAYSDPTHSRGPAPSRVSVLSSFWPLTKIDEASVAFHYDDGTIYHVTVTRYHERNTVKVQEGEK